RRWGPLSFARWDAVDMTAGDYTESGDPLSLIGVTRVIGCRGHEAGQADPALPGPDHLAQHRRGAAAEWPPGLARSRPPSRRRGSGGHRRAGASLPAAAVPLRGGRVAVGAAGREAGAERAADRHRA